MVKCLAIFFVTALMAILSALSIYKVVCVLGRSSRYNAVSKLGWCIWYSIIVVACLIVILKPAIQQTQYSVRLAEYENSIINKYEVIEQTTLSRERVVTEIALVADPDNLDFNTAEEIFQATLDELCDAKFREALKNTPLFKEPMKNLHVTITFRELETEMERYTPFQ